MKDNDVLRRSIRLALVANVTATAGISGAYAATAADAGPPEAAASAEPTALAEVIVTGTRIYQPGLESISPVSIVSSEQIKQQGVTRMEDLLNTLPQVYADQGGTVSNGSTGEATVDLRGLGTQRTLVLINGRRLMPGDPSLQANSAPDINNIPTALVERVDVLTGGASATYGADAVAGVVNFIMNDHFQGVRIDANASEYNHHNHDTYLQTVAQAQGFNTATGTSNDGKTKDISVIIGSNFADDKGNVEVYGTYRRIDALLEAARDYSACTFDPGNPGSVCGGSSTSATGRFLPADGGSYTVGPGGAFVPFTAADKYNFAPTNYFQRPDERWTGGAFIHYDLTDTLQVYNEFMFMHDNSTSQIAPGGAFFGEGTAVDPVTGIPNGKFNVNCNNPLLSPSEVTAICGANAGVAGAVGQLTIGRRNIEGGGRTQEIDHTSFRIVQGIKGDIVDGWKFDAYGMEGQTLYNNYGAGNFSSRNLQDALEVVTSPVTGAPVCASGNTACVPYNIWAPGGVTQAALNYVSIPTLLTGTTEERVISANVTGDLGKYGVKLPTANEGLVVNFGSEWRSEHAELHPDYEQVVNDVSGNGSPTLPLEAGFSVWEGFAEARMPLLQDMAMAKSLSVEAGYRYSAYNLGFDTNTFKGGLDWAPTSDIRFRASYQRAVRAPNLQELFQQQRIALDGSIDPCASTSSGGPPTATAAQCARTGVTAAQYGKIVVNSAGQYNGILGGNPALKPEQSDTQSFGIVLTPQFIPNFSLTVDYFNIHIKNVISSLGANFQLNECLNAGVYCNNVHRDAAGSLWLSTDGYIVDQTLNLGALQTRGADLTADWHLDMGGIGKLLMNFNGTYTAQLNYTATATGPAAGETYDCAGYFGNTCGIPTPKVKTKSRITYVTPFGLDTSLQWRRIGAVLSDTRSPNPLLAAPTTVNFSRIPQENYLDLSIGYEISKQISVRVGANNLLDKDPPIKVSSDFYGSAFVNGNTYPGVYDALGRYLFANVTLNF